MPQTPSPAPEERPTRAPWRSVKLASWMLVGFCVLLMAVGASVKERDTSHMLKIAPGALAQDTPSLHGTLVADNGADGADTKTDATAPAADGDAAKDAPKDAPKDDAAAKDDGATPSPDAKDGAAKDAAAKDAAATATKADAKPADAKPADAADAKKADDAKPADAKVDTKPKPGSPAVKKSSEGIWAWIERGISFLGIFAFLALAWAMSQNRKAINWRLVAVGTSMQLAFAAFIFYVPFGKAIFSVANDVVVKLLEFTNEGAKFIFASFITGNQEIGLINFAFAVLPTIIFFSSFMTVLYHVGLMDIIVKSVAWVMQRLMRTSGAESLSAAANIFVGQTEAPLVVKPFIKTMTQSELMTVMTGGFATVAGGVLALYVGMLQAVFPDIAGHLIAASVMSAPAALVIGKMMVPEIDEPETMGTLKLSTEKPDANAIEAAARGASDGLQLALNVGAMLLAFIALIAMINYILGMPSLLYNKSQYATLLEYAQTAKLTLPEGCATPADDKLIACFDQVKALAGASAPDVSTIYVPKFQDLLAVVFWPVAFMMGVPFEDCWNVAQLLGTKVVLNELVAYSQMLDMLKDPATQLTERSVVITTYALCGFANFGSIAIQIGGLGAIAPERRHDLAKLGIRAMIAGVIAACMTGTVAGILL